MRNKANLLTTLVVIGLVLGVVIGHFFLWNPTATDEARAQTTAPWAIAGDLLFLRPLMLLVVPLIFTSVLTGITSIGDPKRLGLLGGATLLFYLLTMIAAVMVGVTLAAAFDPGGAIPPELKQDALAAGDRISGGAAATDGEDLGSAWLAILQQLIPDNFFQAALERQALSIITATILLSLGLVAIGDKGRPFIETIASLHEALMRIIQWVLWLMPLGVMFLVASAVGSVGIAPLASALGKFVLIVLLGLFIHMLLTLPGVLAAFTRMNPFKYMWSMRPALLTAFGTASSMGTLPVTIETASESGCSKRAAGLVLPLGATVNMDGTALYQGITVIFLFQAFGYDLNFAQYLAIVLTATLAAVGAAGVPGGSLATMIIIISAVNRTLAGGEGIDPLPIAAIGLILPVDRILDMCRTMVNVWGDSVGARVITKLAPDVEEERERAFA